MTVLATAHIASIEGGGTAAEKLVGLQGLCRELGLEPVPETITRCRKVRRCVGVVPWGRGGLGRGVGCNVLWAKARKKRKSRKKGSSLTYLLTHSLTD